jgi:hypothetical protein
MSRKRLKDMLRKEMDERIKTYDTKPVEKPSLKFDLKTDLLGKTETPSVPELKQELKPILKQAEKVIEEPEKKTKEEEPLKRFNKYLEEDESSSESDYSDSEHSEDAEDTYKQYKNKVDKVNFRKVEKSEEYKVKKDIDSSRKGAKGAKADEADEVDEDSGKEDERKDDRKKDDFRKIENERSRKLLDDYKRRDDRDEQRRRDDEPRRRDDEQRRRDDEPRRRDDEPRRRDDEPRRRDEIPSREVHKGNQFLDLQKKHILQIIKSKDVDSISADCVDEIKDILQDFTTHMFELFSDGDKVVIAERDDIKSYISLFIEDDDKEMVDELTLPSKDIEIAINNISDRYNVKIKKDVVYLVHMFLESILVKVITGAKMINEMSKTKRISGKELRTSYKIYML